MVATSAVTGEGVDELWDAVDRHREHLRATGAFEANRRRRIVEEIEAMVAERLRRGAASLLDERSEIVGDVQSRRVDPYEASERVLASLGVDRDTL